MEAFTNFLTHTTYADPIKGLLAAFVMGQVLAWTYEFTYQGLSYSRAFNHTIVLATLAATTVVVAMGQSLVAGFGLIGVLSMVRFRTTLKSSRDLVFVMGAAAIGVACGVGALLAATAGTIGFSLIALYLHGGSFGARVRFDGVLRFRVPTHLEIATRLKDVLESYCQSHAMLSIGEVAAGSQVEHAYQVKFWRDADRQGLISMLKAELQASDVVLLLQETGLEY